jgi:hypothetical protein
MRHDKRFFVELDANLPPKELIKVCFSTFM